MKSRSDENLQGVWLPLYAGLVAVALVLLDRLGFVPEISWGWFPAAGILGAILAGLITLMQEAHRGGDGVARTLFHRVTVLLFAGGWGTWADVAGWNAYTISVLAAATLALCILGSVCQIPPYMARVTEKAPDPAAAGSGRRTPDGRYWEPILRRVTKWQTLELVDYRLWDNPRDGMQLFVALPIEEGITAAQVVPHLTNLAASARLPRGCAITVADSDTQGVVILDVMLRNCLIDPKPVHREPTTPASILGDFPILTTARGQVISICLRIYSMIIGGTVGSGKTTLLHRIIMYLARCTDALIWVIDLNGGGLAEPWVYAWANGRASKPVIDWVADTEEEAAVMVAVGRAIAVDRKTNREAARRRREANELILPVDNKMPAIVVIGDEGGEVRQAASLVGQIVGKGFTRLGQIGRAEAVRTIMSVLRGTSDLTDKALRVVSAIRVCLRMEEHDEYAHVLGTAPPKTDLSTTGAGFLRTASIRRPVIGRTVNVELSEIERHSIECARLRPDLDEYGLRAAASVTGYLVMDKRHPEAALAKHPAFRDADNGLAYTNRWKRYEPKLAEMRGEEYIPDDQDAGGRTAADKSPLAGAAPNLASWSASVGTLHTDPEELAAEPAAEPGGAKIIHFPIRRNAPAPAPAQTPTTREAILEVLRVAGEEGVSVADLLASVHKSRSGVLDQLKRLSEAGEVARGGAGWVLARYAVTTSV